MPKFMFAYHGGKMPETQEAIDKEMAAWGAWVEKYQSVLADPGDPVGQSYTVSASGTADNGGANPLSGYSIVEANDMDSALAIAAECPQVNSGSIEVAEILPIEMG
ncbi:MAG: YciI family protein [Pseudomonadota bacterium]